MEEMEKQEDLVISAPQKESDIKMWYESITYEDVKVFIKTNIISAARSFIAIGFYLKHVRDKEQYQEDGHASIWDFAHAEYGISKSTASRYMTMNDRFSKDGNSPVIAEPYKDFGKSQLQEMLSLNEEQLEQITPGSTVQEIRGMRAPKESPYFEMEGQMELSDFPEVLPESMQQPFPETTPLSQQSQSFVMDASDLFQEQEAIAISQQTESDNLHDEKWFIQQWATMQQNELKRVMRACRIDGSISDKAKAIQKELSPYGAHCTSCSEWGFSFHGFTGGMDFEIGKEKMHLKYGRFAKELLEMYDPWASEFDEEEPEVVDDETEEETEVAPGDENPEVIDGEFTEIHEPGNENLTDLQIAKKELDRANDLLKACLSTGIGEEDFHIRAMKIKVCAMASYVCDLDTIENPPEKPEQPELPILKNNDQRAAFVDAYETWPLWIETVETGERYYRYDLTDGTSMVVKVYHAKLFDYKAYGVKYDERFSEGYGKHEYYLLQEGKFFKDCEMNRSQLIEKLKEIQKKGK